VATESESQEHRSMASKSTTTRGFVRDGLTTGHLGRALAKGLTTGHLSQALASSTAQTSQAGGASNGSAGANTQAPTASTKK
jgi:hypothetical protein